MKNTFEYLKAHLITLTFSTLLWAFISGFILTVCRMIFPKNIMLQNLFTWFIGTAAVCATLAVTAYRTGIFLNGKSVPVSLGVPIFNQIISVVLYLTVFALTKCAYIINPFAYLLSGAIYKKQIGSDFGTGDSSSILVALCFLQSLIYAAVCLISYIIAKNKHETSEAVRKLRGEDKT